MRRIPHVLFAVLLLGCSEPPANEAVTPLVGSPPDTLRSEPSSLMDEHTFDEDSAVEDYAILHVVVADTGTAYITLHATMLDLSEQLSMPIDTMGRGYDADKDLIALPADDADEMYAGDYFPRRFPAEHLSLEYLKYYEPQSGPKTIALVAGIHDAQAPADSVVALLRSVGQQAFRIEAELYLGCMH